MNRHRMTPGETDPKGVWGPRLRILTSAIGKQWIVLPTTFVVATSIGICAIGLLFYVRDEFGAPPAVVSMFGAVWTATYAISCIALRPLSMRLLPRYSLITATVGMAVSVAAMLSVHSLALEFVCYGVYGVALSFFWPPLMGWLSAGLEAAQLNRVIGRYNLSWSTGTIISPFLGGLFYEWGRTVPLYVAGAALSGAAIFLIVASMILPRIRTDSHRELLESDSPEGTVDQSTPLRHPARIVVFMAYFGFGIMVNVLPIHLRDHLGVSESTAGLMLLLRGAATTLTFLLLGRWTAWHFRRWWILIGQVAVLAAFIGFALIGSVPLFAVGIFVFGAVVGITYNNSVFHGISGSRSRAGRMAIHESILNVGVVLGSVTGGTIYQASSFSMTYVVASGVSVVALALVTLMLFGTSRAGASGAAATVSRPGDR